MTTFYVVVDDGQRLFVYTGQDMYTQQKYPISKN